MCNCSPTNTRRDTVLCFLVERTSSSHDMESLSASASSLSRSALLLSLSCCRTAAEEPRLSCLHIHQAAHEGGWTRVPMQMYAPRCIGYIVTEIHSLGADAFQA